MLSVLASRISFSAIMRRISEGLKLPAIQNRFRFVIARGPVGACFNRSHQEKITVFVCKTGRRKIITKRDHLLRPVRFDIQSPRAALATKKPHFYRGRIVIVDLPRRHFPNCLPDRDPFLSNKDQFPLTRHGCDHHRVFAMHNRPSPRVCAPHAHDPSRLRHSDRGK